MAEATPLPWYLTAGVANEPIVQSAAINEDNFVCIPEGDTSDQAHRNAALIVHCVNTYAELVGWIGEAASALDVLAEDVEDTFPARAENAAGLAMSLRACLAKVNNIETKGS